MRKLFSLCYIVVSSFLVHFGQENFCVWTLPSDYYEKGYSTYDHFLFENKLHVYGNRIILYQFEMQKMLLGNKFSLYIHEQYC